MYLSKVLITGSLSRNPYEIHQTLWSLFSEDREAERDFLFRVEQSDRNRADILMQSVRKPVSTRRETVVIASRCYDLHLNAGQLLRFLLVANPIKTIEDETGRKNSRGEIKKCRVPLIKEDEQRAWLHRKFASCASIQALSIDPKLPLYFRKTREDRAGKIKPVVFQGFLAVEMPEVFHELIRAGIGPAKAFGCGLLSVARG